jgi:hypothetical protein
MGKRQRPKEVHSGDAELKTNDLSDLKRVAIEELKENKQNARKKNTRQEKHDAETNVRAQRRVEVCDGKHQRWPLAVREDLH